MKQSHMVAKMSMATEEKMAALQHPGDLYEYEWHDGDFCGDHLGL
jgi:hypothetical protein